MAYTGNLGTKLHGKNGAIWVADGSATPVAIPMTKVASRSEWSLNLSRDYVDSTVFGNTNKTYLVGLKDIQGTYSGILDVSGDLLVDATNTSSASYYVYLYADDTHLVASGPALLDASITASNTDAVRVTGNFRASGNWTVYSGTWS
jgi:hypothetical protein